MAGESVVRESGSVAETEALFESVKNWGRWGPEDERGTLNLITPAKVAAAAANVRGVVVSCGRPLATAPAIDNPMPAQHMMMLAGDCADHSGIPGLETVGDYIGIMFHGMTTSHLDALCHVFREGLMYNGFSKDEVKSIGAMRNSVMTASDGIVSRGILLDIPRLRGISWIEPDDAVRPEELDAACVDAGITPEPGDIVLVSTGRDARRAAHGAWDVHTMGIAGLAPECATWIHEHDVAVLGSDGGNDRWPPTVDGWPQPIHVCCLVAMGVPLLDNLDLSRLISACEQQQRWEFLFTVSPLQVERGTGSPVNPVAIL